MLTTLRWESPLRKGGADGEECFEIVKRIIMGNPKEALISTSHAERLNLTVRMGDRRMIRRTNGFSKRVCRHAAMMSLLVTHYNFCRVHGSLKTTPAVAAGLATEVHDRYWLAGLVRAHEDGERSRGAYGDRRVSAAAIEGETETVTLVEPRGGKGRPRELREELRCPNCCSNWLPKRGLREGAQLYCCQVCGHRFAVPFESAVDPSANGTIPRDYRVL